MKGALRKAALVACSLLVVSGVVAQDAFDARPVAANVAPGYLKVETSNNIVTLQANHVGIQDVLDELARQSDLLVISHGPLHGRLSLKLERLPLSEALRRIMQGRSYLLHQARPAMGPMVAKHQRQSTLWIFTDGSGDAPGHGQASGSSSSDIAAVIAELQS